MDTHTLSIAVCRTASATYIAVSVGGINGMPTAGGTGTSRTVTVSPPVTGWPDVKV